MEKRRKSLFVLLLFAFLVVCFADRSEAAPENKTPVTAKEAVEAFSKALKSKNAEDLQKAVTQIQANAEAMKMLKQDPVLSRQYDALAGSGSTGTKSNLVNQGHDKVTQTDIVLDQKPKGVSSSSKGKSGSKSGRKLVSSGHDQVTQTDIVLKPKPGRKLVGSGHDKVTQTDIVLKPKSGRKLVSSGHDQVTQTDIALKPKSGRKLVNQGHDKVTQTDIVLNQKPKGVPSSSKGKSGSKSGRKLVSSGHDQVTQTDIVLEPKSGSKLVSSGHDRVTQTDIVLDQKSHGTSSGSKGKSGWSKQGRKVIGPGHDQNSGRKLVGPGHDQVTQTDIVLQEKNTVTQSSKSGGMAKPKTATGEYKLKGKSSFGSTKGVGDVTGEVLGGVSTGGNLGEAMVRKMGEAADENRDMTATDVLEVADEGFGFKSTREGAYNIASKHGTKEALKWQKGEQDLQTALVKAGAKTLAEGAVEVGKKVIIEPMEEVVKDNYERMEAEAKAEGRKPDVVDHAKCYVKTLAEGGTNIVVAPLARAYGEATTLDERVALAEQRAFIGQYVDKNLHSGKRNINRIQDELEHLLHNGNLNNAETRARTRELLDAYDSEYGRLKELEIMAHKTLAGHDPDRINTLNQELTHITDGQTMEEYANDMFRERGGRATPREAPGTLLQETSGPVTDPGNSSSGGGFSEVGQEAGLGHEPSGQDGFCELEQEAGRARIAETHRTGGSGEFAQPGDPEALEALRNLPQTRRQYAAAFQEVDQYVQQLQQQQLESTRQARQEMVGISNNMFQQLNQINQQQIQQKAKEAEQRRLDQGAARMGLKGDPFKKYRPWVEESQRKKEERKKREAQEAKSMTGSPQPDPSTEIPEGNAASGVESPGMSYQECLDKHCPMCADSISLGGVSYGDDCNDCKRNKAAAIERCVSGSSTGSGGSSISSQTTPSQPEQADGYWKPWGAAGAAGKVEKNYYAARRYQSNSKTYQYVIGKTEFGGLANAHILYGPTTFDNCKKWLFEKGYRK